MASSWIKEEKVFFQSLTGRDDECETRFDRHKKLLLEVIRSLRENYYWTNEKATRACKEMMRGIYCKSFLETGTSFSLPPQIDLAWHQAILNIKMYQEMCFVLFFKMIDHTTVTSGDPVREKNHRVTATMLFYEEMFGEKPPADLWKREDEIDHEVFPRKSTKTDEPEKKRKLEKPDHSYLVFVKTLTGKTISLIVSADLPIVALKYIIQKREGINTLSQRLVYAGRNLENDDLCWESGLRRESTVHLVLQCSGC